MAMVSFRDRDRVRILLFQHTKHVLLGKITVTRNYQLYTYSKKLDCIKS